jgi:peptidyl-dipeptidase Dcp
MSALSSQAQALLAPWQGPLGGLPPLDRLEPCAIEEAYLHAASRKREEIEAIAQNPARATFENTILALERAGAAFARVDSLFAVAISTANVGEMQQVEARLAPVKPSLEDAIAHNEALFQRVEAVWRGAPNLAAHERRVVEVLRTSMKRRGAGLAPQDKERLAAINARLAQIYAAFAQNLLKDQEHSAVTFDDAAMIDGLSEKMKRRAAETARARGEAGKWAIQNERAMALTALAQLNDPRARARVNEMWVNRCTRRETDNWPFVAEALRLRAEKAQLLGYENYAAYTLDDRMARTPERALSPMRAVLADLDLPIRQELAAMSALAGGEVAEADWRYFSGRLKRERSGFDAEDVRPYLPVEQMIEAVLWAASETYGLIFKPLAGAPVSDPSVRAFSVERRGQDVGALWLDLFSRPGKRPGGWMRPYRHASQFDGKVLPLASINMNVPPPEPGEPCLLTWEFATILFHEMGHALHHLLSEAPYPSLSGIEVTWDFVELPSQLNERWLETPEVLDRFARHHRTGEPIPAAMRTHLQAMGRMDRLTLAAYVAGAIVELELHRDGAIGDVAAREKEITVSLALPPSIGLRYRMAQLAHSFAGDLYAAGFYVYFWADVMTADAAAAFAAAPAGLFDQDVAEHFRKHVLSVGNTVPASDAFRAFRGRDPDRAFYGRELVAEAEV